MGETNAVRRCSLCGDRRGNKRRDTHKVLLAAQPLGPLLLQQALQQVSGRVGDVGLELQRLVEDVVVHLGRVAAVERRLQNSGRHMFRLQQSWKSEKNSRFGSGFDTHQAVEHLVKNGSKTPPVYCPVVWLLV